MLTHAQRARRGLRLLAPLLFVACHGDSGEPLRAALLRISPTEPTVVIGIRTVNGLPQFFNRYTGARFVPRGNNYISLARQTHVSGGTVNTHSMFQVGLYDPGKVEAALERRVRARLGLRFGAGCYTLSCIEADPIPINSTRGEECHDAHETSARVRQPDHALLCDRGLRGAERCGHQGRG